MTPSHRLTSPLNLLPGLIALYNHPAGVLPPLCLAALAVFLPLCLSRCASPTWKPTRGDRIARRAPARLAFRYARCARASRSVPSCCLRRRRRRFFLARVRRRPPDLQRQPQQRGSAKLIPATTLSRARDSRREVAEIATLPSSSSFRFSILAIYGFRRVLPIPVPRNAYRFREKRRVVRRPRDNQPPSCLQVELVEVIRPRTYTFDRDYSVESRCR